MVLDGCTLHPELVAGVSNMSQAHGLQVADAGLGEVAGCQLLKPGPVPSPLYFAQFHRSPFFVCLGDSYCNTIDIVYNNYSSNKTQ